MKHLQEYIFENIINIFENTLSKNDFNKHRYKYVKNIINLLLDNKDVRLGKDGSLGICNINDFDKEKLIKLLNDLNGKTPEDFNNCIMNKNISWNKLCKFDARLVNVGQGNKGEEFEKEFIKDLLSENSKYKEQLLNIIKNDDKFNNIDIAINDNTIFHEGGKNTKRPFTSKNDQLLLNNGELNIGKSVTDVTIKPIINNDNYNIYLSLKEGDKISFCNCGINNSNFFPKNNFNSNGFGKLGKLLLKTFGIDENRFIDIFNNYSEDKKEKNNYENIDVTENISKEKIINLCKSVIGYGYLLCHLDKHNVLHIIDLRQSKNLDDLLDSSVFKLELQYPSNAKRINMLLTLKNIEILFNIRAKDSGIYPTHFQSDYKILDSYIKK